MKYFPLLSHLPDNIPTLIIKNANSYFIQLPTWTLPITYSVIIFSLGSSQGLAVNHTSTLTRVDAEKHFKKPHVRM